MASFLALLLSFGALTAAQGSVQQASQCSCGFSDPATGQLYTESLIVYFNETDSIDEKVFAAQDYVHEKERGWQAIFRQGASPANVAIGNSHSLPWQNEADGNQRSLELYVDPYTQQHLVTGGGLKSVRQDMLYGSFRAALRSGHPWAGGTALSMMLQYNASENMEVDMLNMNAATDARVSTLVTGEGATNAISTNYTILNAGSSQYPPLDPWDFVTVRMDWNDTNVNFWVGENKTRSITPKDRSLPATPQPLFLKHWSTGDQTYMQGPPTNRSVANVAWVRAFFNSSLMTAADHKSFDQRCSTAPTCLMDDKTLRGSTNYTVEATKRWEQPPISQQIRVAAAIVAAGCSSFGIFALINVFFRQTPWHKLNPSARNKRKSTRELRSSLRRSLHSQTAGDDTVPPLPSMDELRLRSAGAYKKGFESPSIRESKSADAISPLPYPPKSKLSSSNSSVFDWGGSTAAATPITTAPGSPHLRSSSISRSPSPASFTTLRDEDRDMDIKVLEPIDEKGTEADFKSAHLATEAILTGADTVKSSNDGKRDTFGKGVSVSVSRVLETPSPDNFGAQEAAAMNAASATPPKSAAPPRIDYLAGLVAIACVGVTLRHFSLTFIPYVAAAQGPFAHNPGLEKWMAIFLGDYFLTPLWIGPFFVTSCRFLTANFLRTGNLDNVAQKIALRAIRMITPVVIITTLEYFLISMGLTYSLQWLPSVSWATWPYVSEFPNFGTFMNDLIQIAYLIPNAAPEIILHYCVGILWTIPVQLQFSYVVLVGVVMIRGIKKPWKRFSFYAFCVVMNWYARSWGACHWVGLMLADLEVTYHWVKRIQSRPLHLYSLLFAMSCLTIATPFIDIFTKGFNFQIAENGLHPDQATGNAIQFADPGEYPEYYVPTLAHLTFAVSLQVIVEMSVWVQKFLSLKLILWIHPHIMTVYLTHGFVFWSWGAWVCVTLQVAGVPYWANLIVVAFSSYAVIALVAMCLTPLIEFTTRATMRNVWRWATERPVPKRKTTAPFNKALVLDRHNSGDEKLE